MSERVLVTFGINKLSEEIDKADVCSQGSKLVHLTCSQIVCPSC